MTFEPNRGQFAEQVAFSASGSGYRLWVTPAETVLSLRPESGQHPEPRIGISLVGANASATVEASDELPGRVNYITGHDPNHWVLDAPTYGRVAVREAAPGIDVLYYGRDGHLEYDVVVSPGTDPLGVRLRLSGVEGLRLEGNGDLVLATPAGPIRQRAPFAYQEEDGRREPVAASYAVTGADEFGFRLGSYDPARRVVIDPVLVYSTYLGGSNVESARGVTVDASGNAYVTGHTESSNFPVTPGALQPNPAGNWEVFVTKLRADGTAIYSTYLGGDGAEVGSGIAADGSGNAYLTGTTLSSNFPTTPGALQPSPANSGDAFVTKLGPTGTLAYSTYLGGFLGDDGQGIDVDGSGNAYVTGWTMTSFPTTPGVFQPSPGGDEDAFVAKLSVDGTTLEYSTFLGGPSSERGTGIAVSLAGDAYVTGWTFGGYPTTPDAYQVVSGGMDGFVTKLTAAGGVAYSTLLGGSDLDQAFGIAADAGGNAYVTGQTYSTDFPTTAGAFQTSSGGSPDAFVTKILATGSALGYSTYFGGSNGEFGAGIAVQGSDAWVTGPTGSPGLATTPDAFQPTFQGGFIDAFVVQLNGAGSGLSYFTYLGGTGDDRGNDSAADAGGSAYVTGDTYSSDFPTTPGAFQPVTAGTPGDFVPDGFVTRFGPSSPTITCASPPAPGSWPEGTVVRVLSDGNDSYEATAFTGEVIYALGGNNRIEGGPGPDIIFGGPGVDRIHGNDGDDLICGGSGVDFLRGGAGNDRLYGEAGNDRVLGGDGDDALFGDSGHDHLDGGAGQNANDGGSDIDLCTNGSNTGCFP